MRAPRFVDLHVHLSPLRRGVVKSVWLYESIRTLLEGARIQVGQRLPSSRRLAADLGISRTTTEGAYSRLEAEGYISRRRGSGTYVRRTRPDGSAARPSDSCRPASPGELFSAGGRRALEAARTSLPRRPRIDPCTAEEELIPFAALSRLFARALVESPLGSFRDLDPLGLPALRRAVARYLFAERGVDCLPEQVVITSGTQQSLSLLAALLVDPGDGVAVEDPGYPEARAAFRAAGATVHPVRVDPEGMDVLALERISPVPRLVYLTPAHQYPLGLEMSRVRRRAILDYARTHAAFIVEDDYDSELRFEGPLESALASTPGETPLFYCGTFNKVFFPSLRVAYLVIPRGLSGAFETTRRVMDGGVGFPTQAVLAEYLEHGAYAAHLRAARGVFRRRRDLLVDRLAPLVPRGLTVGPRAAGLHLCVHFGREANLESILADDLAVQLGIRPLADYYEHTPPRHPGLVIGYGRLDAPGIDALGALLERSLP